jgi:hypothetical protein
MTISVNGNTGITFPDSSLQSAAASPFVLKNRLINSDMRIDQRNAGASVTVGTANPLFTLDRWCFQTTQSSKLSTQQNQGSVTPPAGFSNYLGITSLSAYSVVSSDYFDVQQRIEGFNLSDLDFGKATAKTVTLSFWVRSSLTGTFGGALTNGAFNYSYPFTYTISSANTWTQISVTIAGPTSGTWVGATNELALYVSFGLGMGSTYNGTAGSWQAGGFLSATGATSVVGTNGATFYITGVQLEQNTSATPFERRLYGQELANCQRYFQKSYDYSVVPGTSGTSLGGLFESSIGAANSTSIKLGSFSFPVRMRTAPSVQLYDTAGNAGKVSTDNVGSYTANQSGSVYVTGESNFGAFMNNGVSCAAMAFYYTASAEL